MASDITWLQSIGLLALSGVIYVQASSCRPVRCKRANFFRSTSPVQSIVCSFIPSQTILGHCLLNFLFGLPVCEPVISPFWAHISLQESMFSWDRSTRGLCRSYNRSEDVGADTKNRTDYRTARGDRHIWIWQCHQIYGPYFRDSPNSVLFNSASAQRTIYDAKANVKKAKFYAMWPVNADSANTWAIIDKVKHARKRRILNAAFSDKGKSTRDTHVFTWGTYCT